MTIAVGELAYTVREGLLALAVGAELQVIQVMMNEIVAGRRAPTIPPGPPFTTAARTAR